MTMDPGKERVGMNARAPKRPLEILLVEDSLPDVLLMKNEFDRFGHPVNLRILTDGEQALSFLKREGKYLLAPVPDLVILDLNLPRMDGRALLRSIKCVDRLSDLKIIVVTGSRSDSDIREMNEMRISGYLIKPRDLYGLRQLMREIKNFLLNDQQLPIVKGC